MFNYPNSNRIIPRYTLCPKYRNSILLRSTYFTRRKLWMNYSLYPRQRSLYIFPFYLLTHRTWHLLRILCTFRNLKPRSNPIHSYYSYSLHRIRTSMRTNKILRCNSNHQSFLSYSIYWQNTSRVNMRRLRRRQRHPKSILRHPLYLTIYYRSSSNSSPPISTPNRVKQSNWPRM